MTTAPRQSHVDGVPSVERRTSFRGIWRITWPQMLMMAFHFFIGFADVVVAGRLGREVQAALGVITQSLFFFLIVAIATANGSVAAISQSLGACLFERAKRYAGLSLELAVILGLVFLCVCLGFKDTLLGLLNVPEPIRPVTAYFLTVYCAVLPAYYLLLVTNAVFRAYAWVQFPLFSMMLVTSVNAVADFGLGLGLWGLPNMGYRGVAWATFFSVLAGATFNCLVLWRRGVLSRRTFPPLRWALVGWRYLFKVAWPSGAMQLLWQSAYLALYAITAALPSGAIDALAGMTTGMRIEAALFLPGFAFNMSASILVGHHLGAGDAVEAKRTGYKIVGAGAGLMTLLSIVAWRFIPDVVAFVAPEPAVQTQAMQYLFYNILAIPFTVGNMILGGVMVGAGATVYNLGIFGAAAWLVRLPTAYLLGCVLWRDAEGVWVSMLASQVFQAAVMLYFFQCKDWAKFSMRGGKRARLKARPPTRGVSRNAPTV